MDLILIVSIGVLFQRFLGMPRFFFANLRRARRKGAYILKLASECDVILLQEAHVCRGYSCYLDSALAHSHSLFRSDLDNSPVGGIGIVVTKKFLFFLQLWNLWLSNLVALPAFS